MNKAYSTVLILLLVFGLCVSADDSVSFTEHGERIDNFLLRSIQRMSLAWTQCSAEFSLAFHAFRDKGIYSERDVKARSGIAKDEIAEQAGKFVKEKINETKADILSTANGAIQQKDPVSPASGLQQPATQEQAVQPPPSEKTASFELPPDPPMDDN